ncbi:MAG: hypothetical protein P1U77_25050, partial [Rubripirellula sp.]|nr:hypothetical protein [Rubripirellula sp.]
MPAAKAIPLLFLLFGFCLAEPVLGGILLDNNLEFGPASIDLEELTPDQETPPLNIKSGDESCMCPIVVDGPQVPPPAVIASELNFSSLVSVRLHFDPSKPVFDQIPIEL